MLRPTFNLFLVTFCQEKKENIADFKKKAMGFLADICTFVCNLAVDALNNPRTLNYYEKDGIRHCQQFVINYEDSIRRRYEMEQEAAMRDSIGRLMIQQSKDIRKKMK